MGFFAWFKAGIRNALIEGVREGFAELDRRPDVPLVQFEVSALPAPEDEDEPKRKGKK